MAQVGLGEADRVEITVLVDNYTDLFLLEDQGPMRRSRLGAGRAPLAEHGLAVLARVRCGSDEHTIMLDAGLSSKALLHNIEAGKLDPAEIETLVLSHGHLDHFGGLTGLLKTVPAGMQVVCHPDAFLRRRLNPGGRNPLREMPALDPDRLASAGADVRPVEGASLWCGDLALALGRVERITDFETGFAWAEAYIDGGWTRDPFNDDQGLAFRVKDRGLVVLGGCSHAGIVNTVHYARKVSGTDRVCAVLGGFHLTGPIFEPIIEPTIQEMKKIDPEYIIPMHCTGWKAINRFEQAMPDRFLLNSVGTRYVFGEED
ncbi:MAG: MBL fold metallo-hydrolase [Proteobacteria bacterium]|nr:MBL fold metallo-hydrolase [Pseudomonadota bacterium]